MLPNLNSEEATDEKDKLSWSKSKALSANNLFWVKIFVMVYCGVSLTEPSSLIKVPLR